MNGRFLRLILSVFLLFATALPGMAVTYRSEHYYHHNYRARRRYIRHRRHVETAKRVGIGAAGGAAVGALLGGGKGAAIGAAVGGGAGYAYDRHKKHHGSY